MTSRRIKLAAAGSVVVVGLTAGLILTHHTGTRTPLVVPDAATITVPASISAATTSAATTTTTGTLPAPVVMGPARASTFSLASPSPSVMDAQTLDTTIATTTTPVASTSSSSSSTTAAPVTTSTAPPTTVPQTQAPATTTTTIAPSLTLSCQANGISGPNTESVTCGSHPVNEACGTGGQVVLSVTPDGSPPTTTMTPPAASYLDYTDTVTLLRSETQDLQATWSLAGCPDVVSAALAWSYNNGDPTFTPVSS